MPQNPSRQNIHSETEVGESSKSVGESSKSVGESSKSDIEEELEGIEKLPSLLTVKTLIENEAKRRRCSYNYTLGLSDPDSE
ncbi:hypothetical protein TNIN_460171 [Trichonephila inaurata madagascariensis]|uniref:Uncharacterized protein n=1 Tax=Trichonephila inaurata madagascariensis TaxID=2747483 RepID=A0A8X6XEP5_9ARAC|nr:hypothetical protein TNIN_460171 [Trichonephila inaurata madagascariensis]